MIVDCEQCGFCASGVGPWTAAALRTWHRTTVRHSAVHIRNPMFEHHPTVDGLEWEGGQG